MERREARQLHFDFDALLDVAIKSSKGARQVIGCEKKEGGFNRVFVIKLDTGAKVIARLPTGAAGPPALTVSSEVATLKYGKETSMHIFAMRCADLCTQSERKRVYLSRKFLAGIQRERQIRLEQSI